MAGSCDGSCPTITVRCGNWRIASTNFSRRVTRCVGKVPNGLTCWGHVLPPSLTTNSLHPQKTVIGGIP
eukprot:3323084-Alexandrium_andersonii.AAC.1